MAIYTSVPPPDQQPHTPPPTHAIEAWNITTLQSLQLSNATLSIPLDEGKPSAGKAKQTYAKNGYVKDGYVKEKGKEPLKRDSQRRRELLLRGKEGSRRRQRWENDHLLHVPNAQPPLPSDWAPHATHPIHSVPYYLAPLWESSLQHRSDAARASLSDTKKGAQCEKGRVPLELKMKLKRAKGAKTLLQELEEEVRKFVREWEGVEGRKRGEGGVDEGSASGSERMVDSEDEEIVFVGRNVGMSEAQREVVEEQLEREKLVFEGLADERGGSFGRWLVHSIAVYYGLGSRSVTVGDPARREAYVSIKELKSGLGISRGELPRPLWGLV